MKLARGVVTQHMKTFGETTETGTQVTFKPDGEIFKEGTDFDYDTLKVRMRELAFLNKGLTITLTDVRDGATHQDVFCYAGGIVEFIKFLNEGKDLVDPGVISFEGEKTVLLWISPCSTRLDTVSPCTPLSIISIRWRAACISPVSAMR